MKFITKNLYYSIQFFLYFLPEEKVIDSFCKRDKVQAKYKYYMKRDFNLFIFEYQKIKDILFDTNGNLYDFNAKIYYAILEIAKNFEKHEEESFLLAQESAEKYEAVIIQKILSISQNLTIMTVIF